MFKSRFDEFFIGSFMTIPTSQYTILRTKVQDYLIVFSANSPHTNEQNVIYNMVNITVEITNYGDIANFAERMGLLSFTTEIRKFMISMELQRPTNQNSVSITIPQGNSLYYPVTLYNINSLSSFRSIKPNFPPKGW